MMSPHARPTLREDETGAAMVEFALVFPLQLLFTLGVMQLALLTIGHLVVHYAAFQAARAALITDASGFKTERAAEMVCAAVTHRSARNGLYALTNLSALKTSARILDRGDTSHQVVVEVTHDFELIIPVVNQIFAYPYRSFLWFQGSSRLPSAEDARNRLLQAKYGSPHLRITKICILPKPWKSPAK